MHNESEQEAITNKRLFVHGYHAALTIFKGYGWNSKTVFEKIAKGDFCTEEFASFLSLVVCATDTLPATQAYVSDYWIVPANNAGDFTAYLGEDWQISNTTRASWDPKSSEGGPSGNFDCESKVCCCCFEIVFFAI